MLEVGLGVNVGGGTVLLDNALITKFARGRHLTSPGSATKAFPGRIGRAFGLALCLIGAIAWSGAAFAQAKKGGISLVRDAEIEAALHQMTRPILKSAGISPDSVDIYLVRDKRLNAFVAGGQNLFINTGLIERTEHPGQLIGVIAHEVGHIAGGHLSRIGTAQNRAVGEVLLSTVLGAAAAVAGAPAVGAAIIAGGQTYAQADFLSFTRSQEQAADQAAVSYLDRNGLSSKGLAEFFHILDGQNLLATAKNSNPYLRSHPLTRDRIRFVETTVKTRGDQGDGFPEDWSLKHQRMVVKLKAFLGNPGRTLEDYQGDGLTDRYARAIAYYRLPDLEKAVAEIDGLIGDYPKDPYFHELKGQMLFENGRVKEAIEPYREAVRLTKAPILRFGLAKALIESGDSQSGLQAIEQLEAAVGEEPDNAGAWRLLGIAQGHAGEEGQASLSLAEWALLRGKSDDAKLYARRAENQIGPSDPGWFQLQDILRAIEES